MTIDYAKAEHSQLWLRHPALGDPSFDAFERLGTAIHRSQPPYEWAVNGSLFRDPKDGCWYCYAGLYPRYYAADKEHGAHFVIYRSQDQGQTWHCLGRGFEDGILLEGLDEKTGLSPDAVLFYDERSDLYWLCYDWCTENWTWEHAHGDTRGLDVDSGAALAWASSPAGPFHRLHAPIFRNSDLYGRLGMLDRGYATTVFRRQNDWIALILCDSGEHFSWGLACMTAPNPEGPWGPPTVLLSVQRPEYFPAPVEFYPCFLVGDRVCAPATSVAANRNYQAVFAAALEEAHRPDAWVLHDDGNVWHSRWNPDEHSGIWGQTFHGFVHDGVFTVMYPSKDADDFGILSVASRPWDRPLSDGFTFSGHAGESVCPLLCAYRDFVLTACLTVHGAVELAFDYAGMLGPDRSASDCKPHPAALRSYSAVCIGEGVVGLVTVDDRGDRHTHFLRNYDSGQVHIRLVRRGSTVSLYLDGALVGTATIECREPRPLALIARSYSMLTCDRFEVEGEPQRYALKYNGHDALLGAGQARGDWQHSVSEQFCAGEGFVGGGPVWAKWNVIGDAVTVYSPKSPQLGAASVWVDGYFCATVDLYSPQDEPSGVVFVAKGLKHGRHSVALRPHRGAIAVDCIEVCGPGGGSTTG